LAPTKITLVMPMAIAHMNLQIGSGITVAFENLVLPNKDLNVYNKTRIMDVCRDWHEKVVPLEPNRLVKKYLYGV
jgi:hypothetical protein